MYTTMQASGFKKCLHRRIRNMKVVTWRGVSYSQHDHKRFLLDMQKAGLLRRTDLYNGRFWYKGPAARCSSLQRVLSATKVPCSWDSMGMGVVVHPCEGDPSLKKKDDHESFSDGESDEDCTDEVEVMVNSSRDESTDSSKSSDSDSDNCESSDSDSDNCESSTSET